MALNRILFFGPPANHEKILEKLFSLSSGLSFSNVLMKGSVSNMIYVFFKLLRNVEILLMCFSVGAPSLSVV